MCEKNKRPEITKEIISIGCKEFAKKFNYSEYEAKQICQHYSPFDNGYELAKNLDRYCCWQIDLQKVEDLDCVEDYVSNEHKKACKKWFEENDIKPPLPIGSKIKQGVIHSIYEHDVAYYKVKAYDCNQDGRFTLIKFENTNLLEQ